MEPPPLPEKVPNVAPHDVGSGAVPVPGPEETSLMSLSDKSPPPLDADSAQQQHTFSAATTSSEDHDQSFPPSAPATNEAPTPFAIEPPLPMQGSNSGTSSQTSLSLLGTEGTAMDPSNMGDKVNGDMEPTEHVTGEEGDLIDKPSAPQRLLFANKPESS